LTAPGPTVKANRAISGPNSPTLNPWRAVKLGAFPEEARRRRQSDDIGECSCHNPRGRAPWGESGDTRAAERAPAAWSYADVLIRRLKVAAANR